MSTTALTGTLPVASPYPFAGGVAVAVGKTGGRRHRRSHRRGGAGEEKGVVVEVGPAVGGVDPEEEAAVAGRRRRHTRKHRRGGANESTTAGRRHRRRHSRKGGNVEAKTAGRRRRRHSYKLF